MSGERAKGSLERDRPRGRGDATRGVRFDAGRAAGQAGSLILVVGPSGAGKDTLIDAARRHFQGDPSIIFWERVITRADQTGEAHAAVSETEFDRIRRAGGFFLAWEAHGLHYGITSACLDALQSGASVVANVSRRTIREAREKWPHTHVLYIDAEKDVRRQRLIARGREPVESIDARLDRPEVVDPFEEGWIARIDNSGGLADGIARFCAMIAEALPDRRGARRAIRNARRDF